MTDSEKNDKAYDPADTQPAEGGSDSNMTDSERGQAPHADPAAKDQPAEGGREQAEDQ